MAEALEVGRARRDADGGGSPGSGRRCEAFGCGLEAIGESAEEEGEARAEVEGRERVYRPVGVKLTEGVEVEELVEVAVALGLLEVGEVEQGVGVVEEHGCLRNEWGAEHAEA